MDRNPDRWGVEAFERSFASLCAGTNDALLADTSGPAHLDVGCGTGTLARLAAESGRSVVAVDADAAMVACARDRAPQVDVRQAALPSLGLPDHAFDSATANFVVNHVYDPRAALREIQRVLRPAGRLAMTIWTNEPTVRTTLFADAMNAAGASELVGELLPPEVDFERSVAGLAGIASEAGLTPIVTRELEWTWVVGWDDLWAGLEGGIGSVGQRYLAQDEATRARIESEMAERARALEVDGLMRMPTKAAYVVAEA